MTSVNQEDKFTEVTRKRKKRKAISSPTLSTLQKTGTSELPPGTPTRPKPASIKNKIPVILSGIKEEHKNWRKLMGELRQFHPGLKISQIKELPKGHFLIIGDSMQDVLILQSETKMNAALGQTVNPIHAGGGGGGGSKTQGDIEKKLLSEFTFTPLTVILRILSITIVVRCCHSNLLFPVCHIIFWVELFSI